MSQLIYDCIIDKVILVSNEFTAVQFVCYLYIIHFKNWFLNRSKLVESSISSIPIVYENTLVLSKKVLV